MAAIASSLTTLLPGGVASTAFDPVTGTLYAAMSDGRLLAFDPDTGRQVCEWQLCSELTALGFAADGSVLLAVGAGADGEAALHILDTASGEVTSHAREGAFHDVQVVDTTHAILSGAEWLLLDLATGDLAPIAGLEGFRSDNAIISAGGPLVLLAEWGTANGELAIFDTRTGTVTARSANDGGTVAPGYNFGHQAISVEAGLVLQFSYYGLVNGYDLDLNPLGVFDLGERVDGIAFDADGVHFYAYLIDSGVLAEFDAASFERTGEAEIGSSAWHNFARSGDQIAFSPNGNLISLTDGADGTLSLLRLALPEETNGDDHQADGCHPGMVSSYSGENNAVSDRRGDAVIQFDWDGANSAAVSSAVVLQEGPDKHSMPMSELRATRRLTDQFDFAADLSEETASYHRSHLVGDFFHFKHVRSSHSEVDAEPIGKGGNAIHPGAQVNPSHDAGRSDLYPKFVDHLLEGDLHGDGHADSAIALNGFHELHAADFLL